MYQYANAQNTNVIRLSDGAVIPFDDGNRDYAKYKKWLRDGNEPLPHE